MSKGYIAPTVPEAWTIYEDRLYLNFSLRALELWLQDVPAILPWGMRIGPSLSNKKRGPVALFIVSTFKLIIIPLDQFFACGLNIVRGERTRPVSCLATA
jgi:hypothetical protein